MFRRDRNIVQALRRQNGIEDAAQTPREETKTDDSGDSDDVRTVRPGLHNDRNIPLNGRQEARSHSPLLGNRGTTPSEEAKQTHSHEKRRVEINVE